ncbi:HlyC/CorC family transporter [Mycobacterium sp. M1]|uniref:HlyC/CorC family transporter n=1 Tax=Mycolicibacter acidiphilus TaxID=2835306 RepID=A0ABS5REH5_9MYCO|nr:hemolysin family protein [Mycolicibacter acidiphilus]MBS9532693.1 HlyC/CorC family transporter [Mycolicibacter acidiphilus]
MNMAVTVLSLLAFAVLTLGTAVFVAAEFSLTTLERSVVEANARRGARRDVYIQRAHNTLSFQLSGAQLGISITTLATGYLAEPVLARWLRPALSALGLTEGTANGVALFLALAMATSLSMVFGELVPKNLAVARPLPIARAVAGPQLLFSRMFAYAIRLTNGAANRILIRLGIEPTDRLASARSPRELASLVRNSARSGALDPTTAALVGGSLRFGALTAAELMTPRSKIVTLQAGATVADLAATAIDTGFSRFPVIDGDLDATVGIVHVKQVFGVPAAVRADTPVTAIARPAALVPSTLDGDAVMAQLRSGPLQAALVVDEYGGTAGMLTMEDLIEEIVGDVRDEHDDATPDVVADGVGWQVSGLLRIDEVAAATGYRAPAGGYETIGGLVLQHLGHIPVAGETVDLTAFEPDELSAQPPRWRARVVRMDGRRIDQLSLTRVEAGDD